MCSWCACASCDFSTFSFSSDPTTPGFLCFSVFRLFFFSPIVDPEHTKLMQSYESTYAKNCRGLIEKRAHTIDDFMRGKIFQICHQIDLRSKVGQTFFILQLCFSTTSPSTTATTTTSFYRIKTYLDDKMPYFSTPPVPRLDSVPGSVTSSCAHISFLEIECSN